LGTGAAKETRIRKLLVLTLVLYSVFTLGFSGNAALTPISPDSWDGWDKRLEGVGGILDTLYAWANLTRIADSPDPGDQIWTNLNGGGTAEVKYASYSQVFGYIPGVSGGSFVPLFTVEGNGYAPDVTMTSSGNSVPGKATMPLFRWGDGPRGSSLDPPLWTSCPSDNQDAVGHMVTWKITGNTSRSDNVLSNYVIAWEDLDFRGSTDKDYNDLVVEIHGAPPVPEPSTLMLFGSGLSGLLFLAKRNGPIKS
jgi:hypothetical protein